jgi:hypothetical protein
MTPSAALASHRKKMARLGEDIAVRRYAGTGAGRAIAQEAIARGRPVGLGARDIVGDIKLTDRKVILLNDPEAAVPAGKVALSALLPLQKNDMLAFRDWEVAIVNVDDDTRRIAGVLIALEIIVRG